jgi:hypothetical protein
VSAVTLAEVIATISAADGSLAQIPQTISTRWKCCAWVAAQNKSAISTDWRSMACALAMHWPKSATRTTSAAPA